MIRLTQKYENRWPYASSGWIWQADWRTTTVWRRTRLQAVAAVIAYRLVFFRLYRFQQSNGYMLPKWLSWLENILG